MNYIIRLLNNNDYEKYLELINEFRPTKFTFEEYKNTLNNINKSSEIWIIELDNELIGTGTVIYEHKFIFNISKVAHIEDICVKEKFRKNGYGKIIVDYLTKKALENNCYKVVLECSETIVNFYKKCNFEKRGLQMSMLLKKM